MVLRARIQLINLFPNILNKYYARIIMHDFT